MQPTHVHHEQTCFISVWAMQGSPHRVNALALKTRVEQAAVAERDTERFVSVKGREGKDSLCFGLNVM